MKKMHIAPEELAAQGIFATAMAAMSAEETAKLTGELAPLSVEKVGNKGCIIPTWIGGFSTQILGDMAGGRRCDSPTPIASGLVSFDEIEVWTGRLTRYDWKLMGKNEMYLPCNSNRFMQHKIGAERPRLAGRQYRRTLMRRFSRNNTSRLHEVERSRAARFSPPTQHNH
jgi:hypothetical protein